jgi:hypothetical protein
MSTEARTVVDKQFKTIAELDTLVYNTKNLPRYSMFTINIKNGATQNYTALAPFKFLNS